MRRPASILVLALALLSPPLLAQDLSDGELETFSEVVEVRAVDLQVVVEDRKGNRVEGLRPEDFALWVDGREVPISFFSEVAEGRAVKSPGPAASTAEAPQLEAGEPVGTSYLLFIDELFAIARDRNRVLKGISKQLAQLGPEDRMAVVAFDGVGLDILTQWTGSTAELGEVLAAARKRPSLGLLTRKLLEDAGEDAFAPDVESLMFQAEDHVKRVASAATASLRAFAQAPDRKVMLLVAGGWPRSVVRFAQNSFDEQNDDRGERLLDPVHQAANLLGYTLYPIDAAGIGRSPDIDVTRTRPPGEAEEGLGSTRIDGPDLVEAIELTYARNVREEEVHAAFQLLAGETGGRPLLDNARNDAFRRIFDDTRSYYWLGFSYGGDGSSSRPKDSVRHGESHRIRLEVRRPGLKLRYREGFQPFSRQQEAAFQTESALLLGADPEQAPLLVELGPTVREGRLVKVRATLSFPLEEIAFLPQASGRRADLELHIAALDKRGRRSEIDLIPFSVGLRGTPIEGQMGQQDIQVTVRRTEQKVVFTLRDKIGGASFTAVEELAP